MAFKQLEEPHSSTWESPLLNDIGFIKRNLRYPVNRKTIFPLLWIISSIFFLAFLAMIFFVAIGKEHEVPPTRGQEWGAYLVVSLVLFTMAVTIYRRIQTLRFISVKSPYLLSENINQVRLFLTRQQIAYYHHPQAPEVFQIASRVLDKDSGQREIMVFIADDLRILINSHFNIERGDRGIREVARAGNKEMAKRLAAWLAKDNGRYQGQFSRNTIGK